MATTIRELLVRLGVDANDRKVRRFDAALGAARSTMLLAAGAATALAGALFASAVATANQGDEAAKMGARVGLAAEEVQELTFAVEQGGASVADLQTALRTQARTAEEAAKDTGRAAQAYIALGVSSTDATGRQKPQLDLLLDLADGFKGVTNDGKAAALAQQIFGRSGTNLLPFLRQGADGINALRQQARDLGFVMSEEATKSAEEFTDRLNEMRKIITGVRNRIGLALMPTLTRMISRFRDWFVANREIIDQRLDRVTDGITGAMKRLERAITDVDQAVQDRLGGWEVVFRQIGKVLTTSGIITALRIMVPLVGTIGSGLLAFVSSPVLLGLGLMAALFLGIALGVEDLIVFLQGGNSALGQFLDGFGRSEAVLTKFNDLIEASKELVAALGVSFGPFVEQAKSALTSLGAIALQVFDGILLGTILSVENALTNTIDGVKLLTLALTDFGKFANIALARTIPRIEGLAEGLSAIGGAFGGAAGSQGVSGALTAGAPGRLGAELAFGAGAANVGRVAGALQSLVQEGDTINIQAVASPEEITMILERREAARRQRAMASFRGGDR